MVVTVPVEAVFEAVEVDPVVVVGLDMVVLFPRENPDIESEVLPVEVPAAAPLVAGAAVLVEVLVPEAVAEALLVVLAVEVPAVGAAFAEEVDAAAGVSVDKTAA